MPREAAVGIIGAARGGGGDYRRIAGVIRSRHGGQEHCQHYCKICRRIPNPSRAQPAVTGFRCGMIIARPARVATRRREAGDGFRPALQVTTRDLGADVEIRVHDNGTGIPPELRDKLFQPFFTTKPTGEGTGLGLSISWDIVTQQHRGTITVESAVGGCTEATIRLPRAAPGRGRGEGARRCRNPP
jgi:hypothetical protein